MKKLLLALLILNYFAYAQVGIGTTTPLSTLDVVANNPIGASTAVDGILIPRVDRERALAMTSTPTATLIYVNSITTGTATDTAINITSVGFYYYDGTVWQNVNTGSKNNWYLNGNSATTPTTNYIGTNDNQAIVIKSNNLERMRVLSDGRISINNTSPSTTRLFSASGDTTNTTAIYGVTAQIAPAILAQTINDASVNGAIQGEYNGASVFGSGIAGFAGNTTAGSDFTGITVSAVWGGLNNNRQRSFGIMGDTFNNVNTRTGGVIGTDEIASGALGYYGNSNNSYGVYGFSQGHTTGNTGGAKTSNLYDFNTSIGLGIYGGVIGGWIKGNEYGTVFSGDRFSSYNLGKVISNEDYVIISGQDIKVVSYASTSLQPEINDKGIGILIDGQAFVPFDKSFSQLLDNSKPIIVTCTPMGETKGVYLAEVTSQGFRIKENQNGNSNVSFSWIAIGEKQILEKQKLSSEILNKDFEKNLQEVMHDENIEGGKAIWSQNGKIQFGDKAPQNPIKQNNRRINLRKSENTSEEK